jgi:hypothetical protein
VTVATSSEILDAILVRAADTIGDITAPVMARFYRDHADARASFESLSNDGAAKLEAEMVETILYCVMTWIIRPSEIEIILTNTVPHHDQTLEIRPGWFDGLFDAVNVVIAGTIPADAQAEQQLWAKITDDLRAAVADARSQ